MIKPTHELSKFVQFISRGNVIDLAVGTVIGGAFTAIVTSFTNDLLGPILDMLSSHTIEDAFYIIKPGKNGPYKSFDDAKRDGAVAIKWGKFVQVTINFIIQALCIFFLIRAIDHLKAFPLGKIVGKH